MKRLNIFLVIFTVLAIAGSSFAATETWLTQQRGSIWTVEIDGSNPSSAIPAAYRTSSISVTPNYFYVGYGDFGTSAIYQYDLDGSNPTLLLNNGVQNGSLDVTSNYIYWVDTSGAVIRQADLDGNNVTDLYTVSYGSTNSLVVLDTGIYWVAENRRIWTCDLDGQNAVELLNNSLDRTVSSLTTDGNYLYYTIDAGNTLNRRDMDGQNLVVLMTDATAITVADSLRLLDGRLYWSNGGQKIYSAAADGSESSATEQFDMNTVFGSSSTQEVFFDFQAIPEPATMGLLSLGGIALLRRRRK